nr:MAG TPA: hypothetical protein [Caudoviricetes sp.]
MLLRRYHKPQPEIEAVAEGAEVAAPPKKSAGKKN